MADFGQLLNDVKLIVKNDRRVWAFLGLLGFIGVVMSLIRTDEPIPVAQQGGQTINVAPPSDTGRELLTAFRQDLEKQTRKLAEQEAQLAIQRREFDESKSRVSGTLESAVDKLEAMQKEIEKLRETQTQVIQSPNIQNQQIVETPDGGEPFGFQPNNEVPPPPEKPKPVLMKLISPADTVKIRLLSGVEAPVDGTPYPVVLALDGPITGPDGSSLELGEARILAAATGSETDGRALFRLTTLSFRHLDGRRASVKVDGWVVGEDGIRGMKGKLIDKLGRLIAATFGVSLAATLGERLDTSTQNVEVQRDGVGIQSGDVDVAFASALTDASNRLGKVLIDRYEKLVPVVEILPNRDGVAIFSQATEIAICNDEECGEGEVTTAALE